MDAIDSAVQVVVSYIDLFVPGLHNINTDCHILIFYYLFIFYLKWVKSYFIVELRAAHWFVQPLLAPLSASLSHTDHRPSVNSPSSPCTLWIKTRPCAVGRIVVDFSPWRRRLAQFVYCNQSGVHKRLVSRTPPHKCVQSWCIQVNSDKFVDVLYTIFSSSKLIDGTIQTVFQDVICYL